jgi:hypothetical protein
LGSQPNTCPGRPGRAVGARSIEPRKDAALGRGHRAARTDSAIEVARALCENNRVFLSCRDPDLQRANPERREPTGVEPPRGWSPARADGPVGER